MQSSSDETDESFIWSNSSDKSDASSVSMHSTKKKSEEAHDSEKISDSVIKYDTGPESGNVGSSGKKKHKKIRKRDCEQPDNGEEISCHDNSYLNLQVKQESESLKKCNVNGNNSIETQDSFGELDDLVKNEVKRDKKKKKKKNVDDTEYETYNENEINKDQNGDSTVNQESLDELDYLAKKESKFNKKSKTKTVEGIEVEKSNRYDSFSELDNLVENKIKSEKKKKKAKKFNNTELYKSDDDIESKKLENSDTSTQHDSLGELDELADKETKNAMVVKKNNLVVTNSNNLSDSRNSEDVDISIINNTDNLTNGKDIDSTLMSNNFGTPSILGRIRFENNDVEMLSDNDKSQCENNYPSEKITEFIHNKKYLQQLYMTDEKSVITSDDEIWLVKCPQEVVLESFLDKNITLDSKCKLKISGETYCGTIADETSEITVMTSQKSKFVIKNMSIKGSISFKKRLPKPHIVQDNVMKSSNDVIPLPETKCRHPLFGSNYLQSIQIPKSVQQQINTCDDELLTNNNSKTKKKKHKKHYNSDTGTEHSNQTDDIVVKKAKKRKHSTEEDNSVKKRKKVKKEANRSDVWDSEQAIAESLFNF